MKILILCMAGFLYWAGFVLYIQKNDKKNTQKIKNILYGAMFVTMAGVLFILLFYHRENTLVTNLRLLFLCAALWPTAIRDYREHIIPNRLVLAGGVFWIFTVALELIVDSSAAFIQFKSSLVAAAGIFVVCLLCNLIVRGSVGMGDVKLLMMMGILQGLNGLFSAVFCSMCVSFLAACGLLIFKKKTRKDSMAFAPAVLIGTTISVMLAGV